MVFSLSGAGTGAGADANAQVTCALTHEQAASAALMAVIVAAVVTAHFVARRVFGGVLPAIGVAAVSWALYAYTQDADALQGVDPGDMARRVRSGAAKALTGWWVLPQQ